MQPELQRITLGAILECVFGVPADERSAPLRSALLQWIDGVMQPATFFASSIFSAGRVRSFLDASAERHLAGAVGALEARRRRAAQGRANGPQGASSKASGVYSPSLVSPS